MGKAEDYVLLAAVAFADACTLPALTPECPFYSTTGGAPTCGEQCQSVVQSLGYTGRPEKSVQLGGLVLHGRARPGAVARGWREYDASQIFMEDRAKDVSERRLAAIIMDTTAVMQDPFSTRDFLEEIAQIERELGNRGIVDLSFLSFVLVEAQASRIIALLLLDRMYQLGSLDTIDPDMIERTGSTNDLTGWRACLGAIAPKNSLDLPSLQKENPADQMMRSLAIALTHDEVCRAAVSQAFRGRLMSWLSRLYQDDLMSFVRSPAPSIPLFLAESAEYEMPDDARWVIDRFTKTDLNAWEDASLLLEWGVVQGNPAPLPNRVWRERVLSEEELSLAFMRKSERISRGPGRSGGLEAAEYVGTAREKLLAEDYEGACEIFEGLAVLRGADGDVHNNWAFCMLPRDPARALQILEQSILYPMEDQNLRLANRAFILHVLGRDDEAEAVLREATHPLVDSNVLAWVHEACGDGPVLRGRWTSGDYVEWLKSHLRHDRALFGN